MIKKFSSRETTITLVLVYQLINESSFFRTPLKRILYIGELNFDYFLPDLIHWMVMSCIRQGAGSKMIVWLLLLNINTWSFCYFSECSLFHFKYLFIFSLLKRSHSWFQLSDKSVLYLKLLFFVQECFISVGNWNVYWNSFEMSLPHMSMSSETEKGYRPNL